MPNNEDCCNDSTCPYSGELDAMEPVIVVPPLQKQISDLTIAVVTLQLQMAAMMREITALKNITREL